MLKHIIFCILVSHFSLGFQIYNHFLCHINFSAIFVNSKLELSI